MSDDEASVKPEEYQVVGMSLGLGPPPGVPRPDDDGRAASSRNERPEATPNRDDSPLLVLGQQFAARLQLLWTYVREIGAAAQSTSFANLAGLLALVDEIVESGRGKQPSEALATLELVVDVQATDGSKKNKQLRFDAPLHEERHVKAVRERTKYHNAALRILHETAVQQLVNAYEQLLSDLLRRHINLNTSEAAKDQSITYQQLLDFQSLEEAKRHVVEKQVTDFVRSNDTAEQFRYFKDKLKVDISSNFPDLAQYHELVLRRHAIVHAGTIATPDYLRKLKAIGGFPVPPEGSTLQPSPRYVRNAWETVYSLGVVTFHLMAKTLARRDHDIEAEDAADLWVNNCSYWAMSQKRHGAAERILRYANGLKLAKDTCQLMVLVNFAQTRKWQGHDDDCLKLLDSRDWDATNIVFRLCVAVLRGDEVENLMVRAVKEGELSLDNVYEWPVFQELRGRSDFADLLQKAFGADASRKIEPFPATFLDLASGGRLEKIFEQLNKFATSLGTAMQVDESKKDDSTVH